MDNVSLCATYINRSLDFNRYGGIHTGRITSGMVQTNKGIYPYIMACDRTVYDGSCVQCIKGNGNYYVIVG